MGTYGVAPHYVALGVIAMGFFAARWLNPSVKINLTFVILSLLMSVYACEFILGVTASARADFEVTRWITFPMDATPESTQARLKKSVQDESTFDRRDKLQVIADLAKQGIESYPAVFPHAVLTMENPDLPNRFLRALDHNDVEILPLGGVSNVETVFCNESGEYAIYKSGEYGFHNPSDVWSNQQLDIVAVGDSFTHGACVPSEDNFVEVIRAHGYRTANLGMDSNGPLLELASLKEYAQPFQPKIVLWFYFEGNDLKDMEFERLSPILMRYLSDTWTQDLLNRQGEIDEALKAFIHQTRQNMRMRISVEEALKLHHVRKVLTLWYAGYKQDDAENTQSRAYFSSEVTDEEMDHFRRVLKEADSTVRGWGGQMYFVYLPEWARYADPEFANKNRDRVLSLVNALQLPLIDLHPVFSRHPDPVELFPFRRSNHYSSDGHRLVGEEVLRVLPQIDSIVRPTSLAQ